MNIEQIPSRLGSKQIWEKHSDSWWLVDAGLDVRGMAQLMIEEMPEEARLVTITARPAPDGECRLAYHWDLAGQLLTLVTITHKGSIPSIAALCPAANWIEREIYDYFAVEFSGHQDLRPLVLRPGDAPGLFYANGANGQPGEKK